MSRAWTMVRSRSYVCSRRTVSDRDASSWNVLGFSAKVKTRFQDASMIWLVYSNESADDLGDKEVLMDESRLGMIASFSSCKVVCVLVFRFSFSLRVVGNGSTCKIQNGRKERRRRETTQWEGKKTIRETMLSQATNDESHAESKFVFVVMGKGG